jgi:hypothetical protein
MQTIDFLQTAKWIVTQFSPDTREAFFTNSPFRRRAEKGERDYIPRLLKASHEVSAVIQRLNDHPYAPDVLRAFELENLLDPDFPVSVIQSLVSAPPDAGPVLPDASIKLWARWDLFVSCIAPVEKLTVPQEITNEQNFDDILTLELRYEHGMSPQAEAVSDVLADAVKLYAAIARAYGRNEFPPLRVVYADSGSSIRFDFSGLGEIIKEAKELLVELWNRFRHRKAEDYETDVNALLGGLKVTGVIELYRQQGVLNDEDAARYTRLIMETGTSLFKAGALPREVPKVEVVSNQALLEEIQQKLLPPAPDETKGTNKKQKGEKRAAKKRTRKSSKTSRRASAE